MCKIDFVLRQYVYTNTGQFGKVYKAELKRKEQNVEVAIKIVDNISPDLQKEITIMTEIIHPNIVHLYGLVKEGTHTTQIIQVCPLVTDFFMVSITVFFMHNVLPLKMLL